MLSLDIFEGEFGSAQMKKGLRSDHSSIIDRHLDNCLLFLSSGKVIGKLGVAEVRAGNVVRQPGRGGASSEVNVFVRFLVIKLKVVGVEEEQSLV
jgi:hypothetical protein